MDKHKLEVLKSLFCEFIDEMVALNERPIAIRYDEEEGYYALQSGPLRVIPNWRRVELNGVHIVLEPQPCRLLGLLMANYGLVCTPRLIIQRLWGYEGERLIDEDNTVKTYIGKIRRALGDSSKKQLWIATKYLVGYSFVGPKPRYIELEMPGDFTMDELSR